MPAECRLIINADDLGLSPEIDAGIFEAHRAGVVTAASLLVNFDLLPTSLAGLRQHPHLDVGLHLNLTWGRSLTAAPSLTRAGEFLGGIRSLFQRWGEGRVRYGEVRAEIHRQMSRFADLGLACSHVDTHQHVMLIPDVARAVFELAPRFGFHWIRAPREAYAGKRLKRLVLNSYAGMLYALCKKKPSHFVVGVLYSGEMTVDRLQSIFRRLQPGVYELICHPGAPQDSDRRPEFGRLGGKRVVELRALSSPEVRTVLTERNIQLTSFRALGTRL